MNANTFDARADAAELLRRFPPPAPTYAQAQLARNLITSWLSTGAWERLDASTTRAVSDDRAALTEADDAAA